MKPSEGTAAIWWHIFRDYVSVGKRLVLNQQALITAWRGRAYWLWPIYANTLRLASRGLSPKRIALMRRSGVLILIGESGFKQGGVPGQDLTDATRSWCTETLEFSSIFEAHSPSNLQKKDWQSLSAMVVSYDWLVSAIRDQRVAIRSLLLVMASWRHGIPIFVMLADTFWIRVIYMANFLTVLTRGKAIVLQNSECEARKFGLANASAPHFWTWTESKREQWSSSPAWIDRPSVALVAKSSDPKRWALLSLVQPRLAQLNLQVIPTTLSLSWSAYVDLAKSARVVVTTHELQDWFKVVPSPWFRRRLPTHTITGRIWEAFASSSTLITEDSQLIRSFGFVPGKHFIDSANFISKEQHWSSTETLEYFEQVALAGHSLFTEIVSRYEIEMKFLSTEA